MLDFFNNIGQWFYDLYVSFRMLDWWKQILWGLSFVALVHLMLGVGPYNIRKVDKMIELEYKKLANQHFFVSIRFKLKDHLKDRAQSVVFSRHPSISVIYYTRMITFLFSAIISSIMLLPYALMYLSVGFSLLFGVASMKLPILSPEPPPGLHHVAPHHVDPYVRGGVKVDGYWRGGENGYWRTDPDGVLSNNLGGK
jgi:hypothetical protein